MDPRPVSGINRVVLPGETLDGPAVPDSFRESLRRHDPTLLVTWNARRKRFVIEQCVEHLNPASATEHSHICRRIYVCMAQDEEDQTMIPLGEKVIEMIKARDVTRLGFGPEDAAKFINKAVNEEKEQSAKREAKCAEIVRDCRKDNKRQLRRAIDLIKRHDLRVNQ